MIYMPSVVDSEDTDYFYIKPIGGASRINIKCTGNSIGLSICELSPNILLDKLIVCNVGELLLQIVQVNGLYIYINLLTL